MLPLRFFFPFCDYVGESIVMDSELRDHAQTLIDRIVHLKDSL
jgi:hypothetical protein